MSVFAQCPLCKTVWPTRRSFLADPAISLIGYRVCFIELLAGVFLFRHGCKSVTTIYAGKFADLYDGPLFSERQTGGPTCPGYCLHAEELRPCPAQCECAFVREIVQLITNWPKQAKATSSFTPG